MQEGTLQRSNRNREPIALLTESERNRDALIALLD
jgi:hypothetical protein